MGKHKIQWGHRGWFPLCYGFCPSKKAWDKYMAQTGNDEVPYPTSDARASLFYDHIGDIKPAVLVTVSPEGDRTSAEGVIGILVHEAVHVWQMMCEDAGEHSPSAESEAYAIQGIFLNLLDGYAITRTFKGQDDLLKPTK